MFVDVSVAYHQKVNRKRKDTGNSMKQLWKVLKGKVRNIPLCK